MEKAITVKLGEYDRDEWFKIARFLHPDMTEDEYNQMWADFVVIKEQLKDVGGSA